ncbi:hypothetical protein JTE90_025911 [Oedothorax gibbosus]|uniref:Uncharacterized protein n=1 Tax=Oedothorax gibbosus TaxID=931172 RepID=A0AAV6UUU7_9ARAC|nr:hypothetical protein JTE90_025911 [Oedothorax gibbosus]
MNERKNVYGKERTVLPKSQNLLLRLKTPYYIFTISKIIHYRLQSPLLDPPLKKPNCGPSNSRQTFLFPLGHAQ